MKKLLLLCAIVLLFGFYLCSCSENLDSLAQPCTVNSECDDGLYCTGVETCVGGFCLAGTPVDCEEGEICDEENKQCIIPPCEVGIVPPSTTVFTFEEFQFATTTDGTCETPCYTWEITNQESTGSMIVGAGTNDATGVYTAGGGPGTDTITVTDPCNGNITAEATVTVEEQPCTSDEECDDGLFCNGAETCDIGGTDLCQGGTLVDCDDVVGCTDDSCDEVNDQCVNDPNDANCPDDGVFCNGTEFCDAVLDCSSTGNPCDEGEYCDVENDVCMLENLPPDCSAASANPSKLWSPNHKYVDIAIVDVTDPDGDPVAITIDAITQDEEVNALGTGDGNTSQDGKGVGTGTASIRSERQGTGNGRVYEISFTAEDGNGAECSGAVQVCVPHDKGSGHVCIDDGQFYDSTDE